MLKTLRLACTHSFDLTPREAIELQEALRARVLVEDRLGSIRTVAGIDAGFTDGGRTTRAAVVVMTFPGLELLAQAVATRRTRFPYIPGLLSFREIPAILAALAKLRELPDLILCDGQGYAHPRRFGLASHLGVMLDRPSIGVAKSRLIGRHRDVGARRGRWQPLKDGDETIGAALRTRTAVRPVYVSVGHRISLATAIDHVLRCATRYRLPEPSRAADRIASARDAPRHGDAAQQMRSIRYGAGVRVRGSGRDRAAVLRAHER
ncbi:MAG: deoxyribonuclease V [Chromatiales bacterium]